uniref:Uncharacterized protein n=1 Tax=Monopterus albus TaxID=43700 RepID=A0A3Q3JDX0_MONAL
MYPVDLPDVEDTDLTKASEQYLSSLESSSMVALYLHEKWWCMDDVLRTSDKSRNGLVLVQSIMERVIVFLLSQVVERSSQEEALFSLHPRTESCKLLWRDSQAVGFYTVKHKGSLCDGWSSRCYQLFFCFLYFFLCRGEFCSMIFPYLAEEYISIFPVFTCKYISWQIKYLKQHKEHREPQCRNIWLIIQLGHYVLSTDYFVRISLSYCKTKTFPEDPSAEEKAPQVACSLRQDVALQPTPNIWTLDLLPDHCSPSKHSQKSSLKERKQRKHTEVPNLPYLLLCSCSLSFLLVHVCCTLMT